MGLRTHPCGVPMFVMMVSEVLFPILTDCGLPVKKSRSQSQFVGEFMENDRVEGGTVVDKEHPDVGVLIFQLRAGNMEGSSNGV